MKICKKEDCLNSRLRDFYSDDVKRKNGCLHHSVYGSHRPYGCYDGSVGDIRVRLKLYGRSLLLMEVLPAEKQCPGVQSFYHNFYAIESNCK